MHSFTHGVIWMPFPEVKDTSVQQLETAVLESTQHIQHMFQIYAAFWSKQGIFTNIQGQELRPYQLHIWVRCRS